MPTGLVNPDTEGQTQHDDPGLERVARLERGIPTAPDNQAPSDAIDMSGFEAGLNQTANSEDEADGGENTAASTEQSALDDQPDDMLGRGFTGKDKKKNNPSGWRRKAIITLGGMTFVFAVGGITISIPMLQAGQIIHASQLLKGHFASEDNVNDSRITQAYRYLFARGTSACNGGSCVVKDGGVGDTRLNWIERRMKVSTLKELKSVGIEIWTDRSGNYRGMIIDTKINPEMSGHNEQQFYDSLEKEYGVKKASVSQISEGKFAVRDSHFTKLGQGKLFKFAMSSAGYPSDSAMTWWRRWTLQKFVATGFHPFREIDRKITNSTVKAYENWKKERAQKLRGVNNPETVTIDTSNAEIGEEDANGKNTSTKPSGAGSAEMGSTEINKGLSSLKNSATFKGTALALGVVGIACMAREVYLGAGDINYARNQKPLMNLAAELISGGDQVAADADFSDINLDYVNNVLEAKDENGNISSFFDAASIRRSNGQDGGTDLTAEEKALMANSGKGPEYLAWTDEGATGDALKAICGEIGGGAMMVAGVAIGLISGSIVGTVVGGIAGLALGPAAISFLSDAVSGKALDVANATGVQSGQYADFGAFMYANLSGLHGMGMPLSAAETTSQLNTYLNETKNSVASKSIAYKLFNTSDKDTVAGKIIDSASLSTAGNLAKITSSFASIGFSAIANIGSVITGRASAQSVTSAYNYGASKIGYTTSEINAISGDYDPFENAYEVAGILDADTTGTYVNKALVCNGVKIYKDLTYGWTASIADGENSNGVSNAEVPLRNLLSGKLDPSCSKTDTNWQKIRNFVGDLQTTEGMACYKDVESDTSCPNSGMAGSSTTTTSTSTVNTDDLYKDSTSISCDTRTKDLGIQEVQHESSTFKIRICGIKEIPSSGLESTKSSKYYIDGAEGMTIVNSRVSAIFMNLVEDAIANDKTLSSSSTFRMHAHQQDLWNANPDPEAVGPPGKSNHEVGIAVDFNTGGSKKSGATCETRATSSSEMWTYLNGSSGSPSAQKFGIYQYAVEPWHWDASPTRCKEPL